MRKAFTLIELMVVASIIIILSAVALLNYQSGQSQFALQRSANKLAQDIRRAQEMAMSAKECQECGGGIPPGYGIFLDRDWDNKRYRLYADTDPSQGNEFYNSADTSVGPLLELEKGVIIKDINTAPKKVSINFKPPDPTVKIKFQLVGEIDEVVITLAIENDLNKTKTIKINQAGLIYVE